MADGPLTNIANSQYTVSSTGGLQVTGGTYAGPDSPRNNALNTRVRLAAGNVLIVAFR